MSKVSAISPHVRNIHAPAPLRDLRAWHIWRYERDAPDAKPEKIPYWVNGRRRFGKNGAPQDRANLTTFEEAREAAARLGYDGVAFAPLPDFNIVALDFDRCIGPKGELPPEIAHVVGATYAEYSPSGNGIRAFMRGNLGNHKNRQSKDYAWGFETFSTAGWVTVTGNALEATEMVGYEDKVAEVIPPVMALCAKRFERDRVKSGSKDFLDVFEPPMGLTMDQAKALLSDLDPGMGRDRWIQVGMGLHHEFEGDEDAFLLWDDWSSPAPNYRSIDDLKTQWSSFDRREVDDRLITMRTVRKMSNEARGERGLSPRTFETALERAVNAAKAQVELPRDPLSPYATPEGYEGRFPAISAAEFSKRPPPPWIIKNVLAKTDVAVIYGDSGSGKSFCVLDWALAIATGVPWRGNKVRQGRVVYLAAEGGGGVSLRLQAYAQAFEIDLDGVQLAIMPSQPNFLEEVDMADLIEAVGKMGGAELIIVDTLAQVTPGGQENSSQDMGKAVRHARRLGEATGAMILLVHHSGKDASKGARGWSGLRAASDHEFEVSRREDGDIRVLRVTKAKDGRDDLRWGFKLERVVLGCDEDLDEISSMFVREADIPAGNGKRKKRPSAQDQKLMLELFEKIPADESVSREDLVQLTLNVKHRQELEGAHRRQIDKWRQNLKRPFHRLCEQGFLCEADGRVMIPEPQDDEG